MRLIGVLTALVASAASLKFELPAHRAGTVRPKCIRDFVNADTLVVVTAWVTDPGKSQPGGGGSGGGAPREAARTDIDITDSNGNQYARPRNVFGESRSAFTVHEPAYVSVCFENAANPGYEDRAHEGEDGLRRHVELDVDIGADALDWSAIQKSEKLAPMEADLRRAEGLMAEVVAELEYLRAREARLRDTNESTNDRVKGFALLSLAVLLGTGAWQVFYLRRFFQRKHLI